MERGRRRFLAALGIGGLAGCLGTDKTVTPSTGWTEAVLENVRTGEKFTIGGFDQPTFVHTFATWCSTCNRQQHEFATLRNQTAEIAVVDLTIEPEEDGPTIRHHATQWGFDWIFAVATEPVIAALIEDFGQSIASPPQSPVILLCQDGTASTRSKVRGADGLADDLRNHCA